MRKVDSEVHTVGRDLINPSNLAPRRWFPLLTLLPPVRKRLRYLLYFEISYHRCARLSLINGSHVWTRVNVDMIRNWSSWNPCSSFSFFRKYSSKRGFSNGKFYFQEITILFDRVTFRRVVLLFFTIFNFSRCYFIYGGGEKGGKKRGRKKRRKIFREKRNNEHEIFVRYSDVFNAFNRASFQCYFPRNLSSLSFLLYRSINALILLYFLYSFYL